MQESKNLVDKRETWSKSIDFIFSCAGMTVGVGNLWRFPYLCYENGGGAFLIPYLICAIFLCFPIVFLEISFGQSLKKGLLKSWEKIPLFKGIAFSNFMVMIYSTFMYHIIFTWIIKYFVSSFTSPLPWTSCNNTWNTENCFEYNNNNENFNGSSFEVNFTQVVVANNSQSGENITHNTKMSSAEEFLIRGTWGLTNDLTEIGSLRYDLAGYLLIFRLLVFLAVFRGIKWSAKIVYVTATMPAILIIVVLIRGITLEGAWLGIKFYLLPDLKKLLNIEVWIKASTQVFYSNVVASGVYVTLGSYNKRTHNFHRDSVLIVLFNALTSFVSGFAVFSILGYMATKQNMSIEDVVSSGPGLVFVVYPQALSLLPISSFWAALFFITLLLLGFDSEYVYFESMITFFIDTIPSLRKKHGRILLTAFFSILVSLVGLLMVTEGGVYYFEILNQYGCIGWCIFFIAFGQFIAIGWCYDSEKHWKKILIMVGHKRWKTFLTFTWKYFGPVSCLAVVAYYLSSISPLRIGEYIYPIWAQCLANIISVTTVMFIPIFAVYQRFFKNMSWEQLIGRAEICGVLDETPCNIPLSEKRCDSISSDNYEEQLKL